MGKLKNSFKNVFKHFKKKPFKYEIHLLFCNTCCCCFKSNSDSRKHQKVISTHKTNMGNSCPIKLSSSK